MRQKGRALAYEATTPELGLVARLDYVMADKVFWMVRIYVEGSCPIAWETFVFVTQREARAAARHRLTTRNAALRLGGP